MFLYKFLFVDKEFLLIVNFEVKFNQIEVLLVNEVFEIRKVMPLMKHGTSSSSRRGFD
jgi:hypothetical protein